MGGRKMKSAPQVIFLPKIFLPKAMAQALPPYSKA
jgi:hypothetical protein